MWKRVVAVWRGFRGAAGSGLSTALDSDSHIAAHAFSTHHRRSVVESDSCGCFYCLAIYSPLEIAEWIDDADTALCPKCGVDAVIGSRCGYPIAQEFLRKMQQYWSSTT
jgi:hypothetical protein